MYKILVVGQTPPPFGGQSVMIQNVLKQEYSKIQLFHVRMSFSKEMNDIGRFQIRKIWHLLSLVMKIFVARAKHDAKVLYYPPAGPDKIPMYRDFVILICTRWLFRKTIFHFHAGGVSEIYSSLSPFEQLLFRAAYYHPDGAILLSDLNPRDDINLKSKQSFVIPYGIEDHYPTIQSGRDNDIPSVLFVGILKESKGVLILLDALKVLTDQGVKLKVVIMGKFESSNFQETVTSIIEQNNLNSYVTFTGVLTGDDKWREFSRADIFCFPTFFESETFGLVVLEAMQFKLPTIVSDWRGVPSLVDDGKTGFVVPVKDEITLANKIKLLCHNRKQRNRMGENGRNEYLKNYSLTTFCNRIEEAFVLVSEQAD